MPGLKWNKEFQLTDRSCVSEIPDYAEYIKNMKPLLMALQSGITPSPFLAPVSDKNTQSWIELLKLNL